MNKWYTPKEEEKNEIDEKLEMLLNTVKEKIDIIKEQMNNKNNKSWSLILFVYINILT